MHLTRLQIENVRNIERAELCPAPGYNLITGNNGSGKSSILEAIHCLSTGKSFRTSRKQPLIRHGSHRSIVFAELIHASNHHRAGLLKRTDGSSVIKLDGTTLDNQWPLATLLPVIGHTPESSDLLSDGAKVRQGYLDWLLFHVEPNFRDTWRSYRRVLQQRNSALRDKHTLSVIHSWENTLISLGEQLTQWRLSSFERIIVRLESLLHRLMPDIKLTFTYRQGWSSGQTFQQALAKSIESDRNSGFTHVGPHRADIHITTPHGAVIQELSRGQRKLLVILMRLAQHLDVTELSQQTPVLYIDDMPAELDSENLGRLLTQLVTMQCQLFITATSDTAMLIEKYPPHAMFHVEQGKVTNVI